MGGLEQLCNIGYRCRHIVKGGFKRIGDAWVQRRNDGRDAKLSRLKRVVSWVNGAFELLAIAIELHGESLARR